MDEMIAVDLYADTVLEWDDGFERFFEDNIITLDFPRSLLQEYFNEYFADDCEYDFDTWLKDEYTCDDMDDLYNFARKKGFAPELPYEKFEVEFTATYTVFAKNVSEAVLKAQEIHDNSNLSIYVDGDYWC